MAYSLTTAPKTHQPWHILPLERRPRSVPQLLAKYSFDVKTGYSIYLTDLTRAWSETLDRRQIIKRGLEEDTSIDPSEDASQLKILLDKIRMALQGAEGTFLELLPREGRAGLIVKANVVLPPPLKPLIWPIYLESSAREVLTEELVLPLLGYHLALRDEVESLIEQVKSKDHVISKLLDKMESSGMDLGSVFPRIAGLSTGRKGGQLERAEKLVKGLGRFNEETWMEGMKIRAGGAKSEKEVFDAVFGSSRAGPFAIVDIEITKADSTSNWWENLDAPPKVGNAGSGELDTVVREEAQPSECSSSEEFQTQETPPHLKKTAKKQTREVPSAAKSPSTPLPKGVPDVGDDTTDDGIDALPQKTATHRPSIIVGKSRQAPSADSSGGEAASPGKRGPKPRTPKATRGQKLKVREQGISGEPRLYPPNRRQRSGSETETTSDGIKSPTPTRTKPLSQVRYGDAASPEQSSPLKLDNNLATAKSPDTEDETSPGPLPKLKGRPGTIVTNEKAPPSDASSVTDSSRTVITQPRKTKVRLGMIGGKKKALTSDTEPPNRFSQDAIIPSPEFKPRPSAIGKEENVITEDIIDNPPVKSGRGGKLGLISGKAGAPKTAAYHSSHKASKDEQVDDTQKPERGRKSHSSPPPPSQPVKVPTPPPPETEEEKANRRREELKRQLDAKSKAPVKKKRKF